LRTRQGTTPRPVFPVVRPTDQSVFWYTEASFEVSRAPCCACGIRVDRRVLPSVELAEEFASQLSESLGRQGPTKLHRFPSKNLHPAGCLSPLFRSQHLPAQDTTQQDSQVEQPRPSPEQQDQ